MHRTSIRLFVAAILLFCCTSWAHAETRGVAIVLHRGEDNTTRVTIHSDVKAEKKADIAFDDALKIVTKMEGWGSAVMVCIVAETNPRHGSSEGLPTPAEIAKLLKAIDENTWLSLAYLRIGTAKAGDDLVKHFVQATSGE